MSNLASRPLGEICRVINGRAYKQEELLRAGKYRVLRVGNFFSNGSWYYSDLELDNDKYCEEGDLLFAWSASFGPQIWDQEKVIYHYHIWKMVENSEIIDRHYLYYSLLNSVKGMMSSTHGSIMLHLTKDFMEKLPISFPKSLNEQQELSNILSIIDTKIEVNNRINAELEAMAKTLYNYWFVQFDFPDANGKPYRSSGGKMVYNATLKREIPQGWDVAILGKTLKTSLGGTPAKKDSSHWEGADIPWLSSGEIATFPLVKSEEHITQKGVDDSAAKVLLKGTVLISIVRHIRVSILGMDAAFNQSVVGVNESSSFRNSFIYPYLANEIPRLMSLRTGAQQPHVNKGIVDASPFLVPPNDKLCRYYKVGDTIFTKIGVTAQENEILIQLRDWLLPMLMNGQVTIKQ